MLDLIPRSVLGNFKNGKKNIAISLTTIIILLVAFVYNNLPGDFSLFSTVTLPITKLRNLLHGGYRCPLCGGTRSFLKMSAGNINDALHLSFIGTFLYLYLLLSLPLRLLALARCKSFFAKLLNKTDVFIEENFLIIVLIIFFVQITLDWLGIYKWFA